jgi:hypothetical protein
LSQKLFNNDLVKTLACPCLILTKESKFILKFYPINKDVSSKELKEFKIKIHPDIILTLEKFY